MTGAVVAGAVVAGAVVVVVAVLSFFGKETAAIITLYGVYCTGNVASKFSVTTTRKEE